MDPNIPAFLAGVAAHTFILRHIKSETNGPRQFMVFLLLHLALLLYLLYPTDRPPFHSAVTVVANVALNATAGLTLSTTLYRLFFHRLRHFDGPWIARLSKGYTLFLAKKNNQLYAEAQRLHQIYGDFVRIGPNDIIVNHPLGYEALHARQSQCELGPWHDVLHPLVPLFCVRNNTDYSQRRKQWDKALRVNASENEERVKQAARILMKHLERTKDTPIDGAMWLDLFSLDVAGKVAYDEQLHMLDTASHNDFVTALRGFVEFFGIYGHMTWVMPFLKLLPMVQSRFQEFVDLANKNMQRRAERDGHIPDLFSFVNNSHAQTGTKNFGLIGDAVLLYIAGSDTTATSMIGLLYYLALHHDQARKVQAELDHHFPNADTIDCTQLPKLSHLDGAMNEAMRLNFPGSSGFQRTTPPQGMHIGTTFIPGHVNVTLSIYTVFRDGRNFLRPDEFIPERWTSHKELVTELGRSTFYPFSLGLHSCPGKQLGLFEMKYIFVCMLLRYDLALAPGQSVEEYLRLKKDSFVMSPGPLRVVFTDRKRTGAV